MGRRILPKLDRSVDFSSHLQELAEINSPCDPQDWFPSRQPLEVEVGSGKGLFLLTQSGLHPERNFLGIEIAKKYARFSAYRLAKNGRVNARMIRGDAQKLCEHFLADNSVAAVHVYFPDPWWKSKHRKRRVVSQSFVQQVERILVMGGELHFWTDVHEYFESGCETIQSNTRLHGPVSEAAANRPDDPLFNTHFERRMIINDHDVFRCKFAKLVS